MNHIISFCIAKVKYLLTNKKVELAILVIVIGGRVLQLLYFFNTRNDMTYQILAAENFYEGHGISTSKILADDLSTIIYEPLTRWPPGFSILLIPFYALFKENYITAALTIGVLSAITLIFVCRSILKLLNTPVYLINLFTLITGFSIYYFYNKPCTDATAISFFLIAFYLFLLLLKTNKHYIIKTVGIILSLFICASIKYLYVPVIFAVPLYLILKGFSDKNQVIKKAGFFSFITLSLVFALLLSYQHYISGTFAYIKEPERGFYPENILASHPFIPASFIKPESLEILFKWQPQKTIFIFRIFQSIHLLLFLFLLIYTSKRFIKNRFKTHLQIDDFFYLTFFISLAITLLLMILSLRVAKEPLDGEEFWTYIQEPRYYGLVNVMLHLGAFVLYQYYRLKGSRFLKLIFCLFLLLMLPEMFRGIIFTARRIQYFKKEEYGWQSEYKFQKYTAEIIKNEQAKHQINNIVLIGSSDWMTLRASLYTKIPIFENVNKINNLSAMNTKKPLLLIAILHESILPHFGPFLSSKETRYAGNISGFSFYTNYFNPH